jgi:predicted nucleic acid-binding protein
MDVNDVVTALAQPSVRLAFDTNALWGDRSFSRACRDLHRLGQRQKNQITLFVSAAAHGEKLFDLKQDFQGRYDYAVILESLKDLRLQVQAFSESDAQAIGELLGATFATAEAWHAAKLQHYAGSLGLSGTDAKIQSGKHLSATLDWLIAAHARAQDCILVTTDRGIEFRQVRRMKFAVLQQALTRLLASETTPKSSPAEQGAS